MRFVPVFAASVAALSLAACGSKAALVTDSDGAHQRVVVVEGDQAAEKPEAPVAPAAAAQGATSAAAKGDAEATPGQVVRADVQQSGEFAGLVEGAPFLPRFNFFTHGRMNAPGEPEAVIFVQSNDPNMCAHLTAGTMPRNATMFAVVLLTNDGSQPTVGPIYPAPATSGPDDDASALAYFRRTDASCNLSPGELGATAEEGQAILRSFVPGKHAAVDFKFVLDQGDAVSGTIEGDFCPATALIEDPMAMTEPVAPAVCR